MTFNDLYKSVFAILRIEGNQAKIAGTGFVIQTNPFRILTCNHVVGENTTNNGGNIKYSITKRSDNFDEFDLRQIEISYLEIKKIESKPEYDLAILEIDPNVNPEVANKLKISDSPALGLDFGSREIGSKVEWLSTAASGDLTLTPRFFKGNLISTYVANQAYKYINNQGLEVQQIMNGVTMLEVDQLFVPGCSGSPILNSETNKVIGYVHGYKSWPINANTGIVQQVEIIESSATKQVQLKYAPPLITSLSLAVDIKSTEAFLRESGFLTN